MLSAAAMAAAVVAGGPAIAGSTVYDNFEKPGGYTLADYQAKWANPYGLGEMAIADTRDFSGGAFAVSAAPFKTSYDFSVYDHIKYIAVSTQAFDVPAYGEIAFSATIAARTPGTQAGRVIEGTYTQSGLPYAQQALEAQQAAAVLNMVDFETGQLFDWFIAGNQAFSLVERLPSNVTNPSLNPGDPGYVGIDKMYTQIVDVVTIGDGPHDVSINYSAVGNSVEFYLDGTLVSSVANVGVPLDKQGHPYSGIYPSYGPGESLAGKIKRFQFGHGLFSLLDAFPFQHPDRPDLSVSIPVANRIFGQGVAATFDNFAVATVEGFAPVPEPASWALMIGGFAAAGIGARRRRGDPIAA